jgi:hypothetical protein
VVATIRSRSVSSLFPDGGAVAGCSAVRGAAAWTVPGGERSDPSGTAAASGPPGTPSSPRAFPCSCLRSLQQHRIYKINRLRSSNNQLNKRVK